MTVHRLNPIAWTEGMFLRPQHLQHHDRFSEERLHYHLNAIDPFHWGIRDFAIDEEALSDNRFVVLRLDAVLPGGTIIRYPGNAFIEPRTLDPSSQTTEVHLALRHVSSEHANSSPAGNGTRDVRYIVESKDVRDLNRPDFAAPVDLAFPNLRLFLSGEEADLEAHESFKLAEVIATGESNRPFALSTAYCPPLLVVQASSPLQEAIIQLVSQIAAKMRVVAGRTATIAVADLPRMWMRYTLSRVTASLRHLLSTNQSRPFDIYTGLVEAAAALSAFELEEPATLPSYDHSDLHGCFTRLMEFIDLQLEEAAPDRFTELPMPFDARSSAYLTKELNTDLVDPRNQFILGVKASIDAEELGKMLVEYGKAGSSSGVAMMELMKVQGLRLEQLPGAPTEIAARHGFLYFKVDPYSLKGQPWEDIRKEFTFALNLGKLENAEVLLYVVAEEH